ncbi:phosphoadenosine phosphosulfate reductase domain-containing protein [Burkholderia sp. MBR-1]|uniref:phosphoadenosine phosphosulfate reductase domain-containing protein n=1 Tax=Burkholderia sp. MBR-1 TaxID=2732364 RepID=UPI00215DC29D|nr:phosphoadenosine phosphosulfate reductase family protein [Burkholderia sp. MBR-1]
MGSIENLRANSTPEIDQLLANGAVCAVGVSGGRDSQACALAVAEHLDRIGHTGPRVLVHADLGRVEWTDSLRVCERLAAHLGWELIVVRREAGDMLARWQGRWRANVARYVTLSCVKLILPWSTPAMRFCTSELKTAPITSKLRKRFPTEPIVNVTGVRWLESAARSKQPVAAVNSRLTRRNAPGSTWNAIIHFDLDQVHALIRRHNLTLHEAYTRYGTSRVSCVFCIMGSFPDLTAAATCDENVPVYREMVELELTSTFAFQGNRWLADIAPHLLTDVQRSRVPQAKGLAEARRALEATIPRHLEYSAGWPTSMPSPAEAQALADVRRQVGALIGLDVHCTTANAVLHRYAELMAAKPQSRIIPIAVAA